MRFSSAVLSAAIFSILSSPSIGFANSNHPQQQAKELYKSAKGTQVTTLAEAARKSKRLVGSAVSQGTLNSAGENYRSIVVNEFDYITPENSGKWGPLQANGPDEWDFSQHDQLVAFAQDNNKLYKGHTLVWHSQAPAFINDSLSAAELQNRIDQHIITTMGRYAGQFYGWDVVNEAIDDNANYRDSVLYRKLGSAFIADAFILAHSIDAKAHLYYNDYNIANINAKSDAVYAMLKGLVEAEVPVDGIGFQMHLSASSAPGYEELVENFRRFADLGLYINISELDVRVADLPWDKTAKLAIQQQIYHRVVSACMQFTRCETITTWGFTDAYSWIDSTFGADDPLPFDEAYNRKPAYYGLADGFMKVAPDALGTMPNLIANGQFETGYQGWSSWGGTLEQVDRKQYRHKLSEKKAKHTAKKDKKHSTHLKTGGSSALLVSNRTENWHSAVYDITTLLHPGQVYDAQAYSKIANAEEDLVALSIVFRCENEADVYLNIANDTANNQQWSTLNGQFEAPLCAIESASLYIEGPDAGVDLLIDRVSLRPTALVPDATGLGENIVANGGFESDAFGWFGFGSATITASAQYASSGTQSGYVSNRTATWQGPATSLYLDAQPGTDYQLLAWVRAEQGSTQINGTVKASCAEGDQYIGIASVVANDSGWSTLSGSFSVPNCDLLDLTLYFEGPAAGENFYLDEIYVRQVLSSAIANLVSNGGFESGVNGWSAWGGATLSASSLFAHSGTLSALLSNRSGTWQGPVYDLLPKVVAGGFYEVNAWGRLAGVAVDSLNITLKTACSDGSENYHQLASVMATDAEWTELNGTVVLPNCTLTQAFLYFDGPSIGADIFLDDVVVTGEENANSGNLVNNADFEAGLANWITWGGTLSLTSTAHAGNQAALLSDRSGTWQGPVYNLLGVVEAGQSYDFNAWGMISGAATSTMNITIKTVCDDGSQNYLQAASTSVNDLAWTELSGSVTLPDCNLTEVSLYFDGPAVGIDTLLDDVSVTLSF